MVLENFYGPKVKNIVDIIKMIKRMDLEFFFGIYKRLNILMKNYLYLKVLKLMLAFGKKDV